MKPPRNEREVRLAPQGFTDAQLQQLRSSRVLTRHHKPTRWSRLAAVIKSIFKEPK